MEQTQFHNLTITTSKISETLNKVVVRHEPTEVEATRHNSDAGQARHEAVIDVVQKVKESGNEL